MCDQATETKIRDTVKDFVSRGIMFAAYDVTKTLRSDGTRISHHDVQGVIRNMYENGEMGLYERDTVDVGAPVKPFIYYDPNSDLSQYDKDWVTNNPKQANAAPAPSAPAPVASVVVSAPSAVSAPLPSASSGTGAKYVVVPTKEGRIEIPTVLVKLAATPTQPIKLQKSVTIEPNGVKIPKLLVGVSATDSGCPYRVSKDGRLRLHISQISGYLGIRAQYNVYSENGNVVVE